MRLARSRLGRSRPASHSAPLGVPYAGPAAGHPLEALGEALGVDQRHRPAVLQHVEDRPPVHPGALDGDLGHLQAPEPGAQGQQVRGYRRARAEQPRRPASRRRDQHTGHDRPLGDIRSATPLVDDAHRSPQFRHGSLTATGGGAATRTTFLPVLAPRRGGDTHLSRAHPGQLGSRAQTGTGQRRPHTTSPAHSVPRLRTFIPLCVPRDMALGLAPRAAAVCQQRRHVGHIGRDSAV
jgi:hypothetical protein